MIILSVSPSYLDHWRLGRGTEQFDQMTQACRQPRFEIPSKAALREWSVFRALKEFHTTLSESLKIQAPTVLDRLRADIEETVRKAYFRVDFSCSRDDACNLFALHTIFPHGRVPCGGTDENPLSALTEQGVFIPDFARKITLYSRLCTIDNFPVQMLGAIALPLFRDPIQYWEDREEYQWLIIKEECHLCDSLYDVYSALERKYRTAERQLRERLEGFDWSVAALKQAPGCLEGPDELVIEAEGIDYSRYQALRREYDSLPAIAGNRLLLASAIRTGIGKPVISRCIPQDVWVPLSPAVKDFLLEAAEYVGSEECPPLYPSIPSQDAVTSFLSAQLNTSAKARMLEQLGLLRATKKSSGKALDISDLETYRVLFLAIMGIYCDLCDEFEGANVETSLSLRRMLQLYSLHKRILGLVEYMFSEKIKDSGFVGSASELWSSAFAGQKANGRKGTKARNGLCRLALPRDASTLATLETEGNWLIIAKGRATGGSTGPLDLATLFDDLVSRICIGSGVSHNWVTLNPASPTEHSVQLFRLADQSSPNAACLTLYLGRIALMLRNAIEHGTDRVAKEGLLMECPGYWEKDSNPFKWTKDKAYRLNWRFERDLPAAVPSGAKGFLLTPASLHRCLVLLSLVLHAGLNHLGFQQAREAV
jgi:hypothetical protein